MNKRFLRYIFGSLVFFVFLFSQGTYVDAQQTIDNVVIHVVNNIPTKLTARINSTKPGRNMGFFLYNPQEYSDTLLDVVDWKIGDVSFSLDGFSFDGGGQFQYLQKYSGEVLFKYDQFLVEADDNMILSQGLITDVVSAQNNNPSNSVKVNWGAIELQQNSTGQYTYSITSQGNVTRENATAVYLNVSKTSEQNPQDITYYTLCNYEAAGLSFAVSYPSCAGSQNVLNAQSGFIYKIYFSDGINSSKIINNPNGGQGIYQLPIVPVGGNSSPGNEPEEPGTTTGEQDSSTTTTTTSSEEENPTTTTTQGSDGGLVSKDCGYNLSNGGRVCGFSDLIGLLDGIIQFIFVLAIPIAALVFAYAGFLYLTSGGDTEKHQQAVKAMTTVVKGILVVMVAWLAVKTILVSLGASPDSAWFWLNVK